MQHIGIKKVVMLHKTHNYSYINVYLSVSPSTHSLPAEATSLSEDVPTATNHDLINPLCLSDWLQQIGFHSASLIPLPHWFLL